MKKIIALFFVFVMCFTLAACNETEEFEEKAPEPVLEKSQLIGNWENRDGDDIQQMLIDENGTYRQIIEVGGMSLDHTDSYTISDNHLILYYDEMGIKYTYNVTFDGTDKMNFYNAGNGELIITYTRKTE